MSFRGRLSLFFVLIVIVPMAADVEDLVAGADAALYAAKRAGKNMVVMASSPKVEAGSRRRRDGAGPVSEGAQGKRPLRRS